MYIKCLAMIEHVDSLMLLRALMSSCNTSQIEWLAEVLKSRRFTHDTHDTLSYNVNVYIMFQVSPSAGYTLRYNILSVINA